MRKGIGTGLKLGVTMRMRTGMGMRKGMGMVKAMGIGMRMRMEMGIVLVPGAVTVKLPLPLCRAEPASLPVSLSEVPGIYQRKALGSKKPTKY